MEKVLMVSCEGLGNGGVQSVMMSIVRNLKNKYDFDMLLFTDERRYYDDEFEKIAGKCTFHLPRAAEPFKTPSCRWRSSTGRAADL